MATEEQLEKIRNKHRKEAQKNPPTLNIWRYINSVPHLRKKLSWGIMSIIKGIWVEHGLPRYGQIVNVDGSTSAVGVYDYNPKTDKYDHRSGINFTNTNYTQHQYLEKILNLLYGYILPYERDSNGGFIESTVEDTIDEFLKHLYNHRFEVFDDGKIKDSLDDIKTRCVGVGNKSQKLIEHNHKLIWTDSINYVDDDILTGGSSQDFKGIDGVIKFVDREETNQVKACGGWSITSEGNYKVKVTTSMSQYSGIDYISFTYKGEIIVFKINMDLVERIHSDNVYFIFDSSLLFFTNRLD